MAYQKATEPAEPGEVQPGSGLTVTVAAYQELQSARRDVRPLCSHAPPWEVLNVGLVERTFGQMTAFDGAAVMS
jgi:hypothetical protein